METISGFFKSLLRRSGKTEPPPIFPQHKEGMMAISVRTFNEQLTLVGVPREAIKGNVLNIGSGLSDFVREAGRQEATCLGVDPIYSYLKTDIPFKEFTFLVEGDGLTTRNAYGRLIGQEEMYNILKDEVRQKPDSYVGRKVEDVELPPESQDLIIACQSLTNLSETDLIDQMFRVGMAKAYEWLKPDGQINIYPFYFRYSSGKASLEGQFHGGRKGKSLRTVISEQANISINGLNSNDNGYYLKCLQELAKKGAKFYILNDLEYEQGNVPTHSVLIIRKDEHLPLCNADRSLMQIFPQEEETGADGLLCFLAKEL